MNRQEEDFATALAFFDDLWKILQPDVIEENVELKDLSNSNLSDAIKYAKEIAMQLEDVEKARVGEGTA